MYIALIGVIIELIGTEQYVIASATCRKGPENQRLAISSRN